MADYQPGDVLSMSAPQADIIRVHAPVVPGAYAVTLMGRLYSYTALATDQVLDVAAGIAAVLLNQQAPVALMVQGSDVFVAGQVGLPYSISTAMPAARLEVLNVQPAVQGRPPGRLRVESSAVYFTKDAATGAAVRRQRLTVRREVVGPVNTVGTPPTPGAPSLDTTDPVLDVDASQIRTVIWRQATGQASIFESVAH